MSRYGIGLIVLACVVFAGARYPGFSRDVATNFAPELSDEQRSRIFDSVVRSDVPIAEVGGARSRGLFAGRGANAGPA